MRRTRLRKFSECEFEAAFACRFHDDHLPSVGASGYLRFAQVHLRCSVTGIHQHREHGSLGNQIEQQFSPLCTELAPTEERHAGEVAARPAEIGDEALSHRVFGRHEYDGDGRRGGPCPLRRIAVADDHGHLAADQIARERR
jgi:hypothetical protein